MNFSIQKLLFLQGIYNNWKLTFVILCYYKCRNKIHKTPENWNKNFQRGKSLSFAYTLQFGGAKNFPGLQMVCFYKSFVFENPGVILKLVINETKDCNQYCYTIKWGYFVTKLWCTQFFEG